MSTQPEALRLARLLESDCWADAAAELRRLHAENEALQAQLEAIGAASLAAEQKPVAWLYTSKLAGNQTYITRFASDLTTYKADKVQPLYPAPQPASHLPELLEAMKLIANAENSALDLAYCKGIARAAIAKATGGGGSA